MKNCCSCKEMKEHDNFRRQTLSKDGYASKCKSCSSFDLTVPEQQKECFHYTNLQFLPAIENLQKGSKLYQSPTKRVFQ